VIELRFHHELYDSAAIDEAIEVYAPYAALTLTRDPAALIVKIDRAASDSSSRAAGDEAGEDPALVAAELMNYALGRTVERSRAGGGASV
jgi:hypothetical protein